MKAYIAVFCLLCLTATITPVLAVGSDVAYPSNPRINLGRLTSGEYLSLNWAGYAVTGSIGSVTDVKGTWNIPSLACSGKNSYVAFWVGIDGFNDNTVEQTGVLAECKNARAVYSTWYEFYPASPVYVTNIVPVKAGDIVHGEISYSSGLFTVTLTDATISATFTTSQADSGAQRTSAEWIVEAPSSMRGILPLADFGIASYSADYATVNGVTGPIGSFDGAIAEIVMVTRNLTIKAQPSGLSNDGTSFTVTWFHA